MKNTGANIAMSTMLAADQSISSETHGMKGHMPPVITNMIKDGVGDEMRMNTMVTDTDMINMIKVGIMNPIESVCLYASTG